MSLVGLVCGAACSGLAAAPSYYDQGQPAWRGASGATMQAWTFASTNSSAPDVFTSPGTPAVAVSFGTTGTNSHWKSTFPWDKQGIISGVWNVDPNGSFSFTVPGAVTANAIRYAVVQATEFQYPSGYATNIPSGYATVAVAGGSYLTGSGQSLFTGATNGMGAKWFDNKSIWVLPSAGSSDTVTVTPNYSGSAFDAVVIDTLTVPNISCPGAFSVPFTSKDNVTWSAPSPVQDGTIITSQVCSPASGTAFPLGLTTVNCTNIDLYGNVTTCSFDVTVLPPAGGTITGTVQLDQFYGMDDGNGFSGQDGETVGMYPNFVAQVPINFSACTNDPDGNTYIIKKWSQILYVTNTVWDSYNYWYSNTTLATFTIPTVPLEATILIAKAGHYLSKAPSFAFSSGAAEVDFTGAEMLLAGDINNDDSVDLSDVESILNTYWYSADPAGDANFDGSDDLVDVEIMVGSNWYQVGDTIYMNIIDLAP